MLLIKCQLFCYNKRYFFGNNGIRPVGSSTTSRRERLLLPGCLFIGLVDRESAAMEDGCTVAALAFFVPGHVGKDLVGLEVDDL